MTKTIKESRLVESASEPRPGETTLTHEQLMNSIVNELVRSRIRFRSLLRLLVSKGLLEMSEYVAEYEDQERESFGALADVMMLNRVDFVSKHEDWLKSERGGKFAVLNEGANRPSVSLRQMQVPSSETERDQPDALTSGE